MPPYNYLIVRLKIGFQTLLHHANALGGILATCRLVKTHARSTLREVEKMSYLVSDTLPTRIRSGRAHIERRRQAQEVALILNTM